MCASKPLGTAVDRDVGAMVLSECGYKLPELKAPDDKQREFPAELGLLTQDRHSNGDSWGYYSIAGYGKKNRHRIYF